MSDLKDLKNRIKSVQSIIKVTNAMYLLSASKIAKLELEQKKAKAFSEKIKETLVEINSENLLNKKPIESNKTLLVVFAPQRGMAGSLPTNLYKEIKAFTKNFDQEDLYVINIGKKLSKKISKNYNQFLSDFSAISEKPTSVEIKTISKAINDAVSNFKIQKIFFAYPLYVNPMTQRPIVEQIFPYNKDETIQIKSEPVKYSIEPNQKLVFENLIKLHIENSIFSKELETALSEHSARMVAMKSARDNATQLKEFLNMEYNKERQKIITEEIIEINSGATL
ncbi:MAG: ATP synthase F1 subunit gamma [Niabella sp.]|nr:MAG: ATP synthase F1 subunit gamma [Niabella sp.]